MRTRKYRHEIFKYLVVIEWSEEDRVYLARIPELRGLVTHGRTMEEAARQAGSAIAAWIETAGINGVTIPEPVVTRKPSGRFVTRIDPQLHRNLLIRAKREGKTLNGIVAECLRQSLRG